MAGELKFFGDENADSGLTVVAKVFGSDGNQVGADVSLTENGVTANYIGDFPDTAAGEYGVKFYANSSFIAFDSLEWDGAQVISLSTILTGPVSADICEIYLNIRNPNDTTAELEDIYEILDKCKAYIKDGFYQSSSVKNFLTKEYRGEFDKTTGRLSWKFPIGATVSFELEIIGLNKTVVIPDAVSENLNDITSI